MSEITLLTKQEIAWSTLRATLDKALSIRTEINYPVELSEDAEFLLNLARYREIEFTDPLRMLRNYSEPDLAFLHYSFLLACTKEEAIDIMFNTNLDIMQRDVDLDCLLIISGTLDNWYHSIVKCLREESKATFIMNKFLLIFEKRGLGTLFEKYKKIPLDEGFLLSCK